MNTLLSENSNSTKQWMIVGLYLILFIIIFIIIYYFINLIIKTIEEKKNIKKYTVVLPKSGDGTNFLYCPNGCKRGVCGLKLKNYDEESKPIQGDCQYDFECQYCEDKDTHQFYVGGNYDNQIKIIPTYQQPEIKRDDLSLLNQDIKENNNYIHKLNEKIKYENSKFI